MPFDSAPPTRPPHEAGLRAIIAYKTVRAIVMMAFAAALGVSVWLGLTEILRQRIASLSIHLSHEWAIDLAHLFLREVTRERIRLGVLIAMMDGVVTGFEGWALHHRKPWGEWLVVLTTSSFIPFEIWKIVERPQLIRVAILLINSAIVIYLIERIHWRRTGELPST